MYIRPVHAELDVPTLHTFIETYPLGLLTTHIPHPTLAALQTSHIPFVLDRPPSADTATIDPTPSQAPSLGTLRGHLARANPQCTALLSIVQAATSPASELLDEGLVLFNAPVHSYVTPRFYTDTKPSTGKVVPTWNYAAVQVYGTVRVYNATSRSTPDEAEATRRFLRRQMDDLTRAHEGDKGWKVEDAPERYVETLMKAVVGIEIEITRVEGRFKLSQEMGEGDWIGIVDGFARLGTEEGSRMADMVKDRGKERESAD